MTSRNEREGWYLGYGYMWGEGATRHRRGPKRRSLARFRGIHARTQAWLARTEAALALDLNG